MLSKHEAVGGTGFVLRDDSGRIIASATLVDGEPEGMFVACLLEYLSVRPGSVSASASSDDPREASVLPLRRPRSLAIATQR
jgi:hypothetical protein